MDFRKAIRALAVIGAGVFAVVAMGPNDTVANVHMTWGFQEFNDPNNGQLTGQLTFGVPETDAVQVRGVCGASNGSDAPFSVVTLAAEIGQLKEGAKVNVRFSGGGIEFTLAGQVHGTTAAEGITGVSVRPGNEDELWVAIAEHDTLDYMVPGFRAGTLNFRDGRGEIQKFLAACRRYAAKGSANSNSADAPSSNSQNSGITEKEAFDIAKELGTAGAWQAFLNSYSSGFRADLARAYLQKLGSGQTSSQPADQVSGTSSAARLIKIKPGKITVGKWPERIAYDGEYLWLSESGKRKLARISLRKGRVDKRYGAGRLPVAVTVVDGRAFTLAHTDNAIWSVSASRRSSSRLAKIPRCAQDMVGGDQLLWVLSLKNCSSAGATILSTVDRKSGRVKRFGKLPSGGWAIAAGGGYVFVTHPGSSTGDSQVTIIDTEGRDQSRLNVDGLLLFKIAANDNAAFAGGGILRSENGGIVRFRPGDDVPSHRFDTNEVIRAITATNKHVIAIGREGTIWVLAARDLTLKRRIRLRGVTLHAADVLAIDNTLFIPSFDNYRTDDGDYHVLVVNDWQQTGDNFVAVGRSSASDSDDDSYEDSADIVCRKGLVKSGKCKCPSHRYRVREGRNKYRCKLKSQSSSDNGGVNCADSGKISYKGKCVRKCPKRYKNVGGFCKKRKSRVKTCRSGFELVNGKCYRNDELNNDNPCGPGYTLVKGKCIHNADLQKKSKKKSNKRKCNQVEEACAKICHFTEAKGPARQNCKNTCRKDCL